jgi:hypothetical protein
VRAGSASRNGSRDGGRTGSDRPQQRVLRNSDRVVLERKSSSEDGEIAGRAAVSREPEGERETVFRAEDLRQKVGYGVAADYVVQVGTDKRQARKGKTADGVLGRVSGDRGAHLERFRYETEIDDTGRGFPRGHEKPD